MSDRVYGPVYAPPADDPAWSDDVDVRLIPGDLVRGTVEMIVARPANPRAWLDGIRGAELERIWNESLEREGLTTRVQVVGFEVSEAFLTASAETYGVRFHVVGLVTHNVAIPAAYLVALFVAALAAGYLARVYLNGQSVSHAVGSATGTMLGAGVESFVEAAPKFSLVVAAALFLGVFLWLR